MVIFNNIEIILTEYIYTNVFLLNLNKQIKVSPIFDLKNNAYIRFYNTLQVLTAAHNSTKIGL